MNKKSLDANDVKDVEELKTELKKLPKDIKLDVIKGISLFEAGYNFGIADAMKAQLTAAEV